MRILSLSGLFILISFISGCSSLPDIESGITGTWRCIKIEYEIVKPAWIETNLGSNYKGLIQKHISNTMDTQFTFMKNQSDGSKLFEATGVRELTSHWKTINETQTLDVSLLTNGNYQNPYSGEVKELTVRARSYGYDGGLYENIEAMSWEVKEFDAQNQMLVTETLGIGSVIFTYYLEAY
ncbi:MAG: hypothetical protein ACI9N1_002591 [Flavobacteriales bacterium]|jgi:hypothetical protein